MPRNSCFCVADLSNPDEKSAFCMPGVGSDADGGWQKRPRRDEPAATCEAQEATLSDTYSDSSAAIDAMKCHSHDLDLDNSLLDASSSFSTRATDTGCVTEAPAATEDVEPCESSQEPAWSYLNGDVLQSVFQKLPCQQAITSSGVCKHWRAVALQVSSSSFLGCHVYAVFQKFALVYSNSRVVVASDCPCRIFSTSLRSDVPYSVPTCHIAYNVNSPDSIKCWRM